MGRAGEHHNTPQSLREGADQIAAFEQRDVIQDQVYANETYKKAFASNEWWAGNFIGRMAGTRPAHLPLSADCGTGTPVPLKGSILDPDARVEYYNTLMNQFTSNGQPWRDAVTGSIVRQGGP